MGTLVNVKNVDELEKLSYNLLAVQEEVEHYSNELCDELNVLLEQSNQELGISQALLTEAQVQEGIALCELTEAEAELAKASAELAEAMASENPIWIASASARECSAWQKFNEARKKYNETVEYRKKMEHKVELCEQAVRESQELLDDTRQFCLGISTETKELSEHGSFLLKEAYQTMLSYFALTTFAQREKYSQWKNPDISEKVDVDKPIMPPEINNRMNPGRDEMMALLAELYSTDSKFRERVDKLRERYSNGDVTEVIRGIKTNDSGKLAEEIVKKAFAPYGDIDTQVSQDVTDDRYTKVDVVVCNLRRPIVLSRGISARRGGSIAIEVKSGHKEYIKQQQEHICFQTKGHEVADASCVMVSRDVHELNTDSEKDLRDSVSDVGSRVIAMLPRKDEIDKICVQFILGKDVMEVD